MSDDTFVNSPLDDAIPDGNRSALSANGPLAKWIRVNEEPLLIPHPKGAFDHLDTMERSLLASLDARACVPIFAGRLLIDIVVIRSGNPGWYLSVDDVALLQRIAGQAGLALHNAQLQRSERERLQNAYRAQQLAVAGQLAATVAHEIRNPLTAIRSTVQHVLSADMTWDDRRRLLAGTLDAVDRIDQTIGGVLTLTRSDGNEMAEIDLVKTVDEALLIAEAYARARGIVVERQFQRSPLPVIADRRALQQVCINLFLNACQAMPQGGRATLRCGVTEPSVTPPTAIVQIRDTGSGISPADLAKVFDPFFTTKPGGTGLGLAICLDIITRHRGQLTLASQEGLGTTATILLPLRIQSQPVTYA